MTARILLDKSKQHLATHPHFIQQVYALEIFQSGAQWMALRLAEIRQESSNIVLRRNFNYYGFFKYGICVLAFILSLFFLLEFSIFLIPLSILTFYFVEVHFLFLFPLLIDEVEQPFSASIKLTHKIGMFRAMAIVLHLAVYMLSGLFERSSPFQKWHIGCLAVLFWYETAKASE